MSPERRALLTQIPYASCRCSQPGAGPDTHTTRVVGVASIVLRLDAGKVERVSSCDIDCVAFGGHDAPYNGDDPFLVWNRTTGLTFCCPALLCLHPSYKKLENMCTNQVFIYLMGPTIISVFSHASEATVCSAGEKCTPSRQEVQHIILRTRFVQYLVLSLFCRPFPPPCVFFSAACGHAAVTAYRFVCIVARLHQGARYYHRSVWRLLASLLPRFANYATALVHLSWVVN